jgi:hypothetical protein
MILDIVESINGVPIRLTDERWYDHILVEHDYMTAFYNAVLDAIEYPEFILRGHKQSKIAILNVGGRKWLMVVYKEITQDDGFIISAYIRDDFNKNLIIWRRDN